jgi:hypothetical protein
MMLKPGKCVATGVLAQADWVTDVRHQYECSTESYGYL